MGIERFGCTAGKQKMNFNRRTDVKVISRMKIAPQLARPHQPDVYARHGHELI
jgi:hypothetical protein